MTRLTRFQSYKVLTLLESWKDRIERDRLSVADVCKELATKLDFKPTEPQVRHAAKDIGISWHAGQGKSRVNKEIARLLERMATLETQVSILTGRLESTTRG